MAGKRRGNGEGTIYQRKDGKWCAMLSVGGGQRRTIYGNTYQEVQEKLDATKRALRAGGLRGSPRYTVGEHLVFWLDEGKASHLRPGSYRVYSYFVHNILIPAIGKVKLEKLTAQHVLKLMNDLTREGRPPRAVQYARSVLSQALRHAQAWGLVTQNVATLVTPPAGNSAERPLLSIEQIHTLLEAVKGTRDEPIYWVALQLGLRQGEILGLRWRDIDLDRGKVRIQHTLSDVEDGRPVLTAPKTTAGRREIPMPEALVSMLRNHRAAQMAERMRFRSTWKEHDLVFCSEDGAPILADSLRKRFVRLTARLGWPHAHFHDLRHACATMLAELGVPPRVAMEILGHRDLATTELVYKHVREASMREAVNSLDTVFERLRSAG